jgi:hypothetical protein
MIAKVRRVLSRARAEGSWCRALGKALRQPDKAFAYLRRSGAKRWRKALFPKPGEFEQCAAELHDSGLAEALMSRLTAGFSQVRGTTVRGNAYTPGMMLPAQATLLYALIRKTSAGTVIETGVCNGFSSAIILAALERNGSGHLYSIDLPEFTGRSQPQAQFWEGKGGAVVPAGKQSGWLVPDTLRHPWTLQLGKSAELLPTRLTRLNAIDLFIHDSEHSLENQLFEFRVAFSHLAPGGILFASDINWSKAFGVFSKEVSRDTRHYFVDYSLGLIVRN